MSKVDADGTRLLTMRERAKEARHAAYVLAKERRKNDPRAVELKEKLKQARRDANAREKERRKTDPKEIALKAKLKAVRKEANRLAKEQRKARAGSATQMDCDVPTAIGETGPQKAAIERPSR